jgi:negative regulator of flagellin synthesis FlgM
MAINFNNIGSNQVRDQNRAGQPADAAPGSAESTQPRPREDRVELSDGAQALRSAASAAADLPAVDSARVDAIRRAISEGRYHVDPVRLAQKFQEFEHDL